MFGVSAEARLTSPTAKATAAARAGRPSARRIERSGAVRRCRPRRQAAVSRRDGNDVVPVLERSSQRPTAPITPTGGEMCQASAARPISSASDDRGAEVPFVDPPAEHVHARAKAMTVEADHGEITAPPAARRAPRVAHAAALGRLSRSGREARPHSTPREHIEGGRYAGHPPAEAAGSPRSQSRSESQPGTAGPTLPIKNASFGRSRSGSST